MHVDLIDHMGSDLTVVNAARVSFGKESDWEWYNEYLDNPDIYTISEDGEYMYEGFEKATLSEKDQKLIKYLAGHNHFTPFTHVQITMREKVPIFVARQRMKSSVGFSYNEVSRRYVDDEPELYWPDKWRKKAENAKQGSSDEEYKSDDLVWLKHHAKGCITIYNKMINDGMAPEQARMILPQNTYTEYYTTGSLAAWARAYKLRSDPHSQKEIQDLAAQWNKTISGIEELGHSWRALTQ